MTPTDPNHPPSSETQQQAALTCYLSALLAIAKSMAQVCPQAGLVFSHRLERLPRRLGFDATPKALEESRQALEMDLAEYGQNAGAWIQAGTDIAREILAKISVIAENLGPEQEFHAAMIEGLAEQMEASAEVDDDRQIRPALKRYASGLRTYVARREKDSITILNDLQKRAAELADWVSTAGSGERIDDLTGLLNRREAERQIQYLMAQNAVFSVPVFQWNEANSIPSPMGRAGADQILKEFADRLVNLVRPRDIVCRWSLDQLAVIFDCPAAEATERAQKIAEWMSDKVSVVMEDKVRGIDARAVGVVIEPVPGETLEMLTQRIDNAFEGSMGEQVA
jgi:diguanylate cyclase (GGDEF)-like protein